MKHPYIIKCTPNLSSTKTEEIVLDLSRVVVIKEPYHATSQISSNRCYVIARLDIVLDVPNEYSVINVRTENVEPYSRDDVPTLTPALEELQKLYKEIKASLYKMNGIVV